MELTQFIQKRVLAGNFPMSYVVPLSDFVWNLMVLDEKREVEFQKQIFKTTQKQRDMQMTPYMEQLMNNLCVAYYGETFEKIQENQKKLQLKLTQSILNLHFQFNMPANQIAKALDLDIDFVKQVIRDYKK